MQHGRGAGHLNTRPQRAYHVNIDACHGAEQRFGLQVKVFQLTVQAGDAVAERVHRPFTGGELALQHHQAQGIARQFSIEALTAAGIEHPEQRFKSQCLNLLKKRF